MIETITAKRRLVTPWWREPILLLVGYLHVEMPAIAKEFVRILAGLDYSETVKDLTAEEQWSAAELMATAVLEWPQHDASLNQALAKRITTLIEEKDEEGVLLPLRARVGRVLNRLGDPRTHIMEIDKLQLCFIPAGEFWMDDHDAPLDFLDYDYYLGQTPITQAQYNTFIDDDGYGNPAWWSIAQRYGYWHKGKFHKRTRRATAINSPTYFTMDNHPVVGISWYEAQAYTEWLTDRWQKLKLLPDDWFVRLPSEAEWEKGARGGLQIPQQAQVQSIRVLHRNNNRHDKQTLFSNPLPKRRFPWGDKEPDWALANFNHDRKSINTTIAVGLYSRNLSPYGCLDMVGNVLEWTRSTHRAYPYNPVDGREPE